MKDELGSILPHLRQVKTRDELLHKHEGPIHGAPDLPLELVVAQAGSIHRELHDLEVLLARVDDLAAWQAQVPHHVDDDETEQIQERLSRALDHHSMVVVVEGSEEDASCGRSLDAVDGRQPLPIELGERGRASLSPTEGATLRNPTLPLQYKLFLWLRDVVAWPWTVNIRVCAEVFVLFQMRGLNIAVDLAWVRAVEATRSSKQQLLACSIVELVPPLSVYLIKLLPPLQGLGHLWV